MQAIGWNGTSAGWLGFESDERLCRRITRGDRHPGVHFGAGAERGLRRDGVKRFGLVTPYTDDVQQRIIANYARAGFECVAERHLGWQDNWSFSTATSERLARHGRARWPRRSRTPSRSSAPDCVRRRSSNALERELGIPIYDTIATVVWKSLKLAGADPTRIAGWGRLFRDVG